MPSLLDRAGVGLLRCTSTGRLVEANPASLRLCGFGSLGVALERNVFEHLLTASDREPALQRLLRDGAIECQVSVSGRTLTLNASVAQGPGSADLVDVVLREVGGTELSTSAVVAHDLREPLRTIHRSAAALRERCGDRLDEEARALLEFIEGSAPECSEYLEYACASGPPASRRLAADLGRLFWDGP